MITNDRQRGISQGEADKFREALATVVTKAEVEDDPEERAWLGVFADAFSSQLADLEEDLADYDALRSGQPVVVHVASVDELPMECLIGVVFRSIGTCGRVCREQETHPLGQHLKSALPAGFREVTVESECQPAAQIFHRHQA
jgi:hypothetical protein